MNNTLELITTGYYSLAVTLDEVTLQNINLALGQVYLTMRVDPQYLFLPKQHYEAIVQEIERNTIRCCRDHLTEDEEAEIHATRLINQTSGKLMDIVPLPRAESNIVIFGFTPN